MTRFAIILAVPFFVACATADSACKTACPTATDAEITSCDTSYDACSVGGIAGDLATLCEDAIIAAFELTCDTEDTDTEDTDTEDTDVAE